MKDATLITDGDQTAVCLERELPDPPEVVWDALTEREQLRQWFPCDVVVAGGEWRVGAEITFLFPPDVIDMTLTGEVLEVERPHRLAFSWGEEMLRFELNARDAGTRLVLIDTLPSSAAARNAAGWEVCLDRLAGGAPADFWKERFALYSASFEETLGPQEGPPTGYEGNEAGVAR
jgi:uncharacterized protein YndB with AHSA1/START domain